jgi:hypothetical protein
VAKGAGDHAKGAAAFAFAIAGVHQQQAVFVLCFGDLFIDQGFFALHARTVAFITLS